MLRGQHAARALVVVGFDEFRQKPRAGSARGAGPWPPRPKASMTPLSPVAGPNTVFSGAPFMKGHAHERRRRGEPLPGLLATWRPIASPFEQRRVTIEAAAFALGREQHQLAAGIHRFRK